MPSKIPYMVSVYCFMIYSYDIVPYLPAAKGENMILGTVI
jgi:hypothetical protein